MILINKYVLMFFAAYLIQYIDAGSKCSYNSNGQIIPVECTFLCCNNATAKNEEEACCNTAWIIGLSVGGVALLIIIICVISIILCCCGIACSCLECLLCPCKMCC